MTKAIQNTELEKLKQALGSVLDSLRENQVLIGPVLSYPRIEGGNIRAFVLAYFDRNEGFQFVHCAARDELDRGKIRQMLTSLGVRVGRCESDLELAEACAGKWPCDQTREILEQVEEEQREREAVEIERVRLEAACDVLLRIHREDRPATVARQPGVLAST